MPGVLPRRRNKEIRMPDRLTVDPLVDDGDKTAFLDCLRASFAGETFLKAALGKYRGAGRDAARCMVSRVVLKDVAHLRLVTRAGTQETTQNLAPEAGIARLAEMIGHDYLSATLFTTTQDMSLVYSRKRVAHLTRGRSTLTEAPAAEHNRAKAYLVDAAAPWLAHLAVTHTGQAGGAAPQVKPSMYGKFRQICRFVEILDQLLAASPLNDAAAPRIVDIGSGKGYLTFALHQHLVERLGKRPLTLGLEANAGLVAQCTGVAAACGIEGLSFAATRAENWSGPDALDTGLDILIALHACDTATDDAIHLGITGNAGLIVCAPCCQHEVAPQLEPDGSPMEGLLKFGLLRQRQADLVTDAARALLLEAHGYDVRIIEFVSTEHSAKNLMIAAVRSDKVDRRAAAAQYERLAAFAGVRQQRLARLLAGPTG